MMNEFIMVGVVEQLPEIKQTSTSISYAHLRLSIRRGFKNTEGVYDSDEVTFTLWRGIAENCIDICTVGSLVGIKGRVQANQYTNAEQKTYTNYEFIAEKVSFLQPNQN